MPDNSERLIWVDREATPEQQQAQFNRQLGEVLDEFARRRSMPSPASSQPPAPPSAPAQVPAPVTQALSSLAVGRHTLGDGSVWDKQVRQDSQDHVRARGRSGGGGDVVEHVVVARPERNRPRIAHPGRLRFARPRPTPPQFYRRPSGGDRQQVEFYLPQVHGSETRWGADKADATHVLVSGGAGDDVLRGPLARGEDDARLRLWGACWLVPGSPQHLEPDAASGRRR